MPPIFMLVDFGSTFTKVTVVDIHEEKILGKAQAPTTVEEDITIGFLNAEREIEKTTGLTRDSIDSILACSSAAGGLRMVAIGLVPELTVEAAKRAALGAGAKVVGTYSFELSKQDLEEIVKINPDIILLAGGIDGGNKTTITHNAKMLAASELTTPIIVAGNRVVSENIYETLKEAGKDVRVTDNVMPELGKLEVIKVRETIREVFASHIVKAKGLDKVRKYLDDIVLPTPAAVLMAAELLAKGTEDEPGIGDLIVVDIGGATTDIHSISSGEPSKPGVIVKGLPEPYAKRTVEGDLGIRYNAANILEKAGLKKIIKDTGLSQEAVEKRIQQITKNVNAISTSAEEKILDKVLAVFAVKTAMERHAGIIKEMYTPTGEVSVQYGKDLTKVSKMIGVGGIFCYGSDQSEILKSALFDPQNPWSLKPQGAELFIDKEYIMAHMGLLASKHPIKAFRILKKYLYKL
ncbi:MAG: hypothetical protein PWQ82_1679 [Thermosediminibacterales bacterium]|nr:hypothetical protein [Thermosediminibacterales bacterium]MDK2836275.1 hypothetical protein [Thermosediminibacterales bacterium]